MAIWARVKTKEQLESVVNSKALFSDCIILDFDLACDAEMQSRMDNLRKGNRKFYYQLPDILRNPSAEKYVKPAQYFDGLVIKNLDELGMTADSELADRKDFEIIGDAFLYAYNPPALKLYRSFIPDMKFILSDELNKEELNQLVKGGPAADFILKVYGHQPVMITAQCLNKNYGRCRKQKNFGKDGEQKDAGKNFSNPVIRFKDETGEEFISAGNCPECYSVIYKAEPTCILSKAENKFENMLFDFTVESGRETEKILNDRYGLAYNGGHFDKGIE